MMSKNMPPRWLQVKEAAELLNVSEATIRRCLRSGELEGIKVRGAVRVDRDDLERMSKRRRYVDVASGAPRMIEDRFDTWFNQLRRSRK